MRQRRYSKMADHKEKKAQAFKGDEKVCRLYLEVKIMHFWVREHVKKSLNWKTEFVSKCEHQNKFVLYHLAPPPDISA